MIISKTLTRRFVECLIGFGLIATANAQLLQDSFNGTSIDSGIWQTSNPFSDSSITEGGGNAIFQNRGRLLSVASFPTSIDITGSFEFTGNSHDSFEILTRTNGVSTNSYGEFDLGIIIRFEIQDDTGNTSNNIAISHEDYPYASPTLATANYAMALDTFYNFRITDDGTNIAVYVSNLNVPLVTATDSSVLGNQLGLYNREGAGGGSSISAGSVTKLDSITAVPEPASFWLLLSGGICTIVFVHVKRAKAC